MNNRGIRLLSIVLAVLLAFSMVSVAAFAIGEPETESPASEMSNQRLHDNIDISSITGEGGNPGEISSLASTLAAEKEWYEYISYSDKPVSTIRLSDERRLVFYDPYDYADAMIMEITGEEAPWSSANSLTVSYTTSNSLNLSTGETTNTSTSVQVQDGMDTSGSDSKSESKTTTTNWTNTSSGKLSATIGSKIGTKATIGPQVSQIELSAEISASSTAETGYSNSVGGSGSDGETTSTTSGWSLVANRVTTTTGSSTSTTSSWSTTDSKTVSRTYNATYFNDRGSPLQWKIVEYTVYMPMKYELQCLMDGEWISTDSSYCILTTLSGTCRSWMENNVTYYEHWGTGEPVTWNDFWSTFFTKEELLKAYNNKLYPDT